jgi:hypothetical protein
LRHDAASDAYLRALSIASFLLLKKGYRCLYGVGSWVSVGVRVNVAATDLVEFFQSLSGYRFFSIRHLRSLSVIINVPILC